MPAMGGTPCWLPSDGVPDAWDEGELLPDPPDLEEGQAFVHRLGLSGGREEFVTRADVLFRQRLPAEEGGVADLATLQHLNEPAIIQNLKVRPAPSCPQRACPCPCPCPACERTRCSCC